MSTREMTRAADSATSGDAERGDCVISRGRLGVHGDLTAYQGLSAAQFGTSAARVGDMATSTLQLAVVDDHPAILRGVLAGLQEFLPQLTSPLSAATVSDLFAALGGTGFLDVVVLDVQLADDSDPASNVARLVDAGLPVLLYTQEGRRSVISRCFKAGASGIVSKSEELATLAAAILQISQGQAFLNAEWAAALEDAEDWPVPDLAPREAEALRLYATGLPMKSVARRMQVAEDTAKEYLDRARQKYAKAGRPAYSKVDLYIRAVEDGYLPAPQDATQPPLP
ncbi:MAG TPA: response regulator transcription factor [Dermatophilaceae bacterium]|jgi:DNA-binding NarL/FixJ family response regulator|nr:response regulator transcription factor [Actinomycetales bacterium]HMT33571.1 response regulator transcription factor [Dermatophilaceae bacterium]HMT90394.1 response regulator transcription factor [Dermatophilaceae bacterium]